MKTAAAVMTALVSMSAFAQSDLKSFLDAAETANVDRRITVEQRNRAAADFTSSWTALLPSLTVQGGWTNNQYEAAVPFENPVTGEVTRLVIIPENQFDATLRVDLPLIDTQRWMRAAAAGASEDSAEFREQVTRDQIRRQVVASYYGYAASLALLQSAKKSLGVAEAQLKLMEIRTQAGSTTELDLIRARSEHQRNKQVVADAVSLVATSKRTLRTLTGLEPADALPEVVDNTEAPAPLAELEDRIEELPALKAAQKDYEAAANVAMGSKLALVPTVGANFTQRFTNATGFQNRAAIYSGGITATWRLDGPTFTGMRAQDAAASAAHLAIERTRLQARDQVNSDWQRVTAGLIKIEAAKAQVEAAQRAAQVSKDRYTAGAATQLDVIQAERDLFGAEVSFIQARTDLATSRASLLLSSALPLE